jgi:quercetin dioxygenase-like cupin family protein
MVLSIRKLATMSTKPNSNPRLTPAETYSIMKLVDYAEGAIVSRTLVENNSGTVTLFAFDAGQNLSEHTTPFDALVHVLEGKAEFVIGGKAVEANTDEILLMPANVPHAVKALEHFKMLLIILRNWKAD